MRLIITMFLVASLSGCALFQQKIEVREIIVPCVNKTDVPNTPNYEFEELPRVVSEQDEAEAVRTLYKDKELAKAYGDALRYLITPCIGVRDAVK